MRLRNLSFLTATFAAAALLAACGSSGSGGGNPPPGPGATASPSPIPSAPPATIQSDAVAAANGLGAQIANTVLFAGATSGGSGGGTGSCVVARSTGTEYFKPAQQTPSDPNSTENITFYDTGCTQKHTDVVRTFVSGPGTGETVTLTSAANPVPPAVKGVVTQTQTLTYSNTTFDVNGFPNFASGYDLSTVTQTSIDGTPTIRASDEVLEGAQNGNVVPFCSDAVGYRSTAGASPQTYGWSGQTDSTNGSRITNADGSVTVAEVHLGTPYSGLPSAFAIATGTPNAACPITTPEFTLTGVAPSASYRMPISMTFVGGAISSVTVTNASFAGNLTLNVVTSTTLPPTDPNYIVGTLFDSSAKTVANFNVNGSGAGALTIASGLFGPYTITNFRVLSGP